jgi:hypothetical protein
MNMPDYHNVLKTAIHRLENKGLEQRRTVYLNARNALIRTLRAISPPLSLVDIARLRLELEQAIREIERESAGDAGPEQAATGSEEPSISGDTATASAVEMASAPAETEPALEDAVRQAVEAAKSGDGISTSVASTPSQDETVRVHSDETAS